MPALGPSLSNIDLAQVSHRKKCLISTVSTLLLLLSLLLSQALAAPWLQPRDAQRTFGTQGRGGLVMGSSEIREHLDLSYAGEKGEERQRYDLFLPAPANVVPGKNKWPLLIFIHGGAWRSGSKSAHHDMARHLASSTKTPTAVALIEYRLSVFTDAPGSSDQAGEEEKKLPPTVFHPDHQNDVQAALSHILLSPSAKGRDEYEVSDVVLAGHSIGAFMALGVALEGEKAREATSPKAGEIEAWEQQAKAEGKADEILPLMPPTTAGVRQAIGTYVCVDGIYSLPSLLTRYPSYSTFVYQAFARPTGLAPASVEQPTEGEPSIPAFEKSRFLSNSPEAWPLAPLASYPHAKLPRMELWHSTEDELLDVPYSREAVEMLMDKVRGKLGGDARHEELEGVIGHDFSFKGTHDGMLQLPAYWEKLLDVVARYSAAK